MATKMAAKQIQDGHQMERIDIFSKLHETN